MNIESVTILAGCTLATAALIAALSAMRATRRWREQCDSLQSSIAGLRRELEMVASISVRTGRRVQRVESEFSGVTERVDLFESRQGSGAGAGTLDHAIDLARRGAASDRLERQFGLSAGEADLVARLHGRDMSRRSKLN